jgi:hypothetical protein
LYEAIATDGSAQAVDKLSWEELTTLLGQPELLSLEERYS